MHKIVAVVMLCLILGVLSAPHTAIADNFIDAHYDAATDELVVTLSYTGTNPDHQFNVQWGACADAADNSGVQRIDATIDDDQWRDAARENFQKTIRVSLGQLRCRPAILTLHTAPRFFYTVSIPAARKS